MGRKKRKGDNGDKRKMNREKRMTEKKIIGYCE